MTDINMPRTLIKAKCLPSEFQTYPVVGSDHSRPYTASVERLLHPYLRKMEAEPHIHEAGLLLVVFNESAEVLAKDLELFEDVLARKEVLAGYRHVRSVPIIERIGHRLCTVALWPTIQRDSWCGAR